MCLVSVIVPIYNVGNYLVRCIQSIIKQSYKNLEILLVDDGSTDNSASICKSFATEDKRVIYLHKKNGGLSSARNYGIDNAHGLYYVFVDGDDYIKRNMISVLMKKKGNADLVICNFDSITEKGKIINTDINISKDDHWSYLDFWNNYYRNNLWVTCVVAWNKLYSRTLFRKLRYPYGKYHEDEFVIENIISNCNYVKVISDSLYYYVQRKNSIMHSEHFTGALDLSEAFLQRIEVFIHDNKLNEAIIIKALEMIPRYMVYGSIEDRKRFNSLRSQYYLLLKDVYNFKIEPILLLKAALLLTPKFSYHLLKIWDV